MKQIYSVLLIALFVVSTAIYLSYANTEDPSASVALAPVIDNAFVYIEDAYVNEGFVHARIYNGSDVAITLIESLLVCTDFEETLLFGNVFSEEDRRYVPIGVPTGESRMLASPIKYVVDDECSISLLRWSKYEENN